MGKFTTWFQGSFVDFSGAVDPAGTAGSSDVTGRLNHLEGAVSTVSGRATQISGWQATTSGRLAQLSGGYLTGVAGGLLWS
jgi:hypothetical protein